MSEMNDYRAKLVERLHQLHTYVLGMHELPQELEMAVRDDTTLSPNDREGILRLFFLTAQHWPIWQYTFTDSLGKKTEAMLKGMAFLTGCIDMEYFELDTRTAYELGNLSFHLPTLRAPDGRDWRVGTFNLYGNDIDESPLDVEWTREQIRMADDNDASFV